MAPRQRSLWWTSWTSTTTTRSTPPEPIYFAGWAETARPRPPTTVRPPWLRRTPSGRSSGSGAEVRAELLTASPRLTASPHRQAPTAAGGVVAAVRNWDDRIDLPPDVRA